MHSITVWKLARRPNYNTNINHIYHYSEVPYVGEYFLVRLPLSSTNLIDHVDYWGEGKIESQAGISGFANCYNVNHQYQLVSNGPDRDRKIPNRIPVISYTNCNTSSYIKDNSVKLVTLMGAPINKSCAKDIARMVNYEVGSVVVFGFEEKQQDIRNLDEELKVKGILYCHGYELPETLQGLTLFGVNSHRVYTNILEMSEELRKKVVAGNYDSAVKISSTLDGSGNGSVIATIVRRLLESGVTNTMEFAYKLWNTSQEIVTNYFPVVFKLIFKGSFVKIMGRKNFKTVKLNANAEKNSGRFAWCDGKDNTSTAIRWELYPIWENNNVFFKIKNPEYNLFLRIDETVDEKGNRKVLGSEGSNEIQYQWVLEPLKVDDDLIFYIADRKYKQKWKADDGSESYLYASSADDKNSDDLRWFLAPWE